MLAVCFYRRAYNAVIGIDGRKKQKVKRVFALKQISIVGKALAVSKNFKESVGVNFIHEHIGGRAYKYKVAFTEVRLQFLFDKVYRPRTSEAFVYRFHVAVGAVVRTLSFYRIPKMGNEPVHIPFSFS
jgi:hypothetical protein